LLWVPVGSVLIWCRVLISCRVLITRRLVRAGCPPARSLLMGRKDPSARGGGQTRGRALGGSSRPQPARRPSTRSWRMMPRLPAAV